MTLDYWTKWYIFGLIVLLKDVGIKFIVRIGKDFVLIRKPDIYKIWN